MNGSIWVRSRTCTVSRAATIATPVLNSVYSAISGTISSHSQVGKCPWQINASAMTPIIGTSCMKFSITTATGNAEPRERQGLNESSGCR